MLLMLPMCAAYAAVANPTAVPVLRLQPSSEVVAAGSVWTCTVSGAAHGSLAVVGLPGATQATTASGRAVIVWHAPAHHTGHASVGIVWRDALGRVLEQRTLTLVLAPAAGGAG